MANAACLLTNVGATSKNPHELVYDSSNLRAGLVPSPPSSGNNVIVVDDMVDIGLILSSDDFFDIQIGTVNNGTDVKKCRRSYSTQSFSTMAEIVTTKDKITINNKIVLTKKDGTVVDYGKHAYIYWEKKKLMIAKS